MSFRLIIISVLNVNRDFFEDEETADVDESALRGGMFFLLDAKVAK